METSENDNGGETPVGKTFPSSLQTNSMHSDVIDYESLLVDKPREEMICTLCYTLMVDPVILFPCGHTFCGECISNRESCPYTNCSSPQFKSKSHNRAFKQAIDRLSVRCRFQCGHIFPLERREQHEQVCYGTPVECPNGCIKQIARTGLKDHMESCPRKTNICECGQPVPLEDITYHLKNECNAPKDCNFCGERFEEKDQIAHNERCTKRKVMIISLLFPHLESGFEFVEDITNGAQGNMDDIMKEICTMYQPTGSVLEVFNLSKNVREHHLQEIFSHVCPSVKLKFEWSFSDGTWVWIFAESDEAAKLLQSTLQAHGFPFIRSPLSEENKLWFGSFSHLTFCPPINTVDCPIHTFVTTTCPFKHNMYKNGQCIRWKAGQLCGKPTTCKFGHPGKTVVDLRFMSRAPNICKFCQKSSHFGWECPDRVSFANNKKDIINHVEGVAKTLETILMNEGGQMLANRAGIALRRANPATAAVLQEQFGGKLKKLLEAYSGKFTITNQEQPGFAIIQLNNMPTRNGNEMNSYSESQINGSSSGGMFSMPSPGIPSKPFRRVPLLEREWSIDSELLPFVHNVMKPHFDKIKNNVKTDKRLLPDLQALSQELHGFQKDSNVNILKGCMSDLAGSIANVQLAEYEPSLDPFAELKEKIKALQQHNPNLARALNLVRKYSLSNETQTTSYNPKNGFQLLNEHDSLAETFNRLTEALGIFFRSSNQGELQRREREREQMTPLVPNDISMTMLSEGSNISFSTFFSNTFPLPSQEANNDNRLPLYQRIGSFSTHESLTHSSSSSESQSPIGTPSPPPLDASYGTYQLPMQNSYNNVFSQPQNINGKSSYAPFPSYTPPMAFSPLAQNAPGDMFGQTSGTPTSMYNPLQGFGLNQSFQSMNLSHSPQFTSPLQTYGRSSIERVCLNCGAINSHTSSQCRGCSWCGRTNHIPEQCTSKLPRCGYCSKQHNKGLGHKTRDCRYLQSGKGV